MPDEIVIPEGFTRWDPEKFIFPVEVILRNGEVLQGDATDFNWRFSVSEFQIIAYRVLP